MSQSKILLIGIAVVVACFGACLSSYLYLRPPDIVRIRLFNNSEIELRIDTDSGDVLTIRPHAFGEFKHYRLSSVVLKCRTANSEKVSSIRITEPELESARNGGQVIFQIVSQGEDNFTLGSFQD